MIPGPKQLSAVFAGGVLGALARAGLNEAFTPAPGHWPWITFAINVAGAAALGAAFARLHVPMLERWAVGPGFCGALTTFSTMQLELLNMVRDDRLGLAAGYAAASIVCGLAAIELGKGIAGGWGVGPELPQR